jgi:hypothetical protein
MLSGTFCGKPHGTLFVGPTGATFNLKCTRGETKGDNIDELVAYFGDPVGSDTTDEDDPDICTFPLTSSIATFTGSSAHKNRIIIDDITGFFDMATVTSWGDVQETCILVHLNSISTPAFWVDCSILQTLEPNETGYSFVVE